MIKKVFPDIIFSRGSANKRGMVSMDGASVPADKIDALLKKCKKAGMTVKKGNSGRTIVTPKDTGRYKDAGFMISTKGDTSALNWYAYE